MKHHHTSEEDRFAGWLARVRQQSLRIAAASGRPRCDHDDLVSAIVAEAVDHGAALMERYPDACVYARVRFRHAAESFYRRERAQRGHGARLRSDGGGDLVVSRPVVSYEAARDNGVEVVADHDDDRVVELISARDRLGSVLSVCALRVSLDDMAAYVLKEAYGVPVSDLAAERGVTRETMSRRISRVARVVDSVVRRPEPPV